MTGTSDPNRLNAIEHDAEKLHDFSGNIMRQNKHLERNRDSDLSHFALGSDLIAKMIPSTHRHSRPPYRDSSNA